MVRRANKKSRKLIIFLVFLCIPALLAASLWFALKHGIAFDRIQLSSATIEHINVRIDGGIFLSADRIEVFPMQASESSFKPELFITAFNKWSYLFQEIRINKIRYQGHMYHLLFRDNRFTVAGDDFRLVSTLTYDEGRVLSDISRLEVKPYQVTLSGKATYVSKTEQLDFSGNFSTPETSGKVTVAKKTDRIDAEINTGQFTDLTGLLARLHLDIELTSWIADNITARDYQIKQLRVSLPLRAGKPDIDSISISGKAIAPDAAIKFDPALPPVQCKQIDVSLENDRLAFALDKPTYKTKSLAGSSVTIDHLFADVSPMDINIQTKTRLDDEILNLLETYNIRLPFTQQKGITRGDLHLVFDLPDFTLHTSGVFTTGKGNWTWGDISFKTDEANVQLKDDLIHIDNAAIVYQDIIRADLHGTVETATEQAFLTADIEHLHFRDGEKDIVTAQNLSTPINIQFSGDEVNIDLPVLQADITLSPSRNLLALDDLNKVKPFIPFLQDAPFQDGKVNINFTDPANPTFNGFINTTVLPLSFHDQQITHFIFKGSKNGEQLTASMNEGQISLTVSDKISIQLHDYLLTVDTDSLAGKAGPLSTLPIIISGPRSLIKSEELSITTKEFQTEQTGSDVTYTADLDQGKMLFQSNGENMTLAASEVDAQVARDFFDFADLQGGRFNLSLKGKNIKNCEGFVEFSNVLIKDLAILNNVLSFLNTIPALATLSSPGFDTNGYHVREGVAHFSVSNNLLTIQQLRTDGTTIDTETTGWIDFENNILKMNMELISLKDFSKIINLIPLAGYAILGENGSLSTSLLISGSRKEPEITTNLSSEIVLLPINIIKRTIEWPFRIFDKITEPEPEK